MNRIVTLIYGAGSYAMFAAVTTAYILAAIQLEERDLMDTQPEYGAYLAAMSTSILASSAALLHVHVVAAFCTIGLGAVGTVAIHVGVRTVPEPSPAVNGASA